MKRYGVIFAISIALLSNGVFAESTNIFVDGPPIPEGFIRLGSSCGMKHGGYYEKFFTVHEVSTNVFAASPNWSPSSLKPIPLPIHRAYALYIKWRNNVSPSDGQDSEYERIELSSKRLPAERYFDGEKRWFYTITYNMNDSVIILLDGSIVTPRVIDLRTVEEKKKYEDRMRAKEIIIPEPPPRN